MGAAGDEEPMQAQSQSGCPERIFVSVRLRPLNEKEIARNDVSDWECINDSTIIYRNNLSVAERSMYPTSYTFDRVFSCDCTTRKVYEEGAKEVALAVVSGINSSVFAYGQTSSGKTYTMIGITEYTMSDIYDYIEKHKEREFVLKFSAMEIYNESVRDLLSADTSPLRLLDDPERGTIVEKLTEETLKDWNHLKELLSTCEAQRQIGETSLNETSSRSHQILRLTVESSACEFIGNDPSSLTATVNFVDLAGSERASQALSAGTRLKEGCHINRSLLTLGTVIRKLSKGRNGHVPFRDSKLTRILQSSLGGNARTAIICTLSPARSHVEQSRNTLLFASCAKEVTTNAQINIVMSDKALVKHLQRELSRLENELRGSGPVFVTPDSVSVLREKDLRIEKLEKEVDELTMQRDLARTEVENLLRGAGKGSAESPPAGLDHQYPRLRVRSSWDFENLNIETQNMIPHCIDISVRSSDTSPCSDGHSSSDENFFPLPSLEENILKTKCNEQDEVSVPSFVGTDLHQEEIEEQNDENADVYKNVGCVQMGKGTTGYTDLKKSEPSLNKDRDLNMTSVDINPATSGVAETEDEDEQCGESRSTTLKEQNELNNIILDSVTPSTVEPSPWRPEKYTPTPSILNLTRSRSCKACLMTSYSPDWFENDEKVVSTPPIVFEKDFTGRPRGLEIKVSALKYAADTEISSTNESQTSARSSSFDDLKSQNVDTLLKSGVPAKSVRDIGVDNIQEDFINHWEWPLEFKRLQREIIELWHACNVSLVHRTYFFLLFKGDPKDSIYMEVEQRRLSFLKDSFSRGNDAIEDGRTVSLASSMKALRRERHMLSQHVKKRFSREQRENLFLKWGIGLQTKHRSLQLAHLLWTSKDLNHVAESAAIVSKLVTFVKPDQAFREMFGLNFAPRRPNKKFSLLKRSVISIL
ncbi:kinesin-like protein KIN-7G [Citrus sinensis]|uniref:Kinesin-like protein KIN-7G n=2 Tax=Citrus sinensis TaxID=2711 RepID=A0ACB8J2G3_CITSI|nr:kinesin-like protein KIN-7G [Citrus sinensis]